MHFGICIFVLGVVFILNFVLKDKSNKEDIKMCTHPTHPYHTQTHTHT